MISKIYGDMSAIKENVNDYLDQGYFWPVSENEFEDFYKFMHDEYISLSNKLDNTELQDIAIVEFTFVKQLLQLFHYNYVKKYCEINGIELILGTGSEYIINPDFEKIKNYYSSLKPQHNKLLRIIRRIIRNILFNKHLSLSKIVLGFLFGSTHTSVGSNDQIKSDFIFKNKVFYDHVDWPDLIENVSDTSENHNDLQDIFLDKIINPFLNKLCETDSLFVKDVNFKEVADAWSTRSFDALKIYKKLNCSVKSSELLITEISKPIAKLITLAYQRSNCKVFCFHHGNDAAATIQKQTFSANVSHCNKFVLPTSGIASRYQKHYSNVDCIGNSKTDFLSVNSKTMYDLFLKNTSKIVSSEIETIMLIGYPFNSNRYIGGRGLFFYQQVELEYRLISLLKSKNIRVIYKAHPDRLKEVQGVFDNIVDEVNIEPFEKVWEKADLLIFTYSSTSTFGYALTTNIPIILLDSDSELRDPDDMLLLDKRVSRIVTKRSINTKIKFSKEVLFNELKRPKDKISFDYVEDVYKTL